MARGSPVSDGGFGSSAPVLYARSPRPSLRNFRSLVCRAQAGGHGRCVNVDHSELHRSRTCSLLTMLRICNLAQPLILQVVMGPACQMRVQAMHPGAITETARSGRNHLQGEGIRQCVQVSCEGMHPRASAAQESSSRHLFCISASTWQGEEQAQV